MATGDRIDIVEPHRYVPENGFPNTAFLRSVGGVVGFPMVKQSASGFQFITRVPTNGTPLSTGLTFQLLLVDDPNNSSVGKVAKFGVTAKKLASTTDDLTQTGAGTENTGTATMNATSGIVTALSIALTTANADSPSAGDLVLIRVRRLGTDAADTHTGVVLVVGLTVSDT